ncbi:MAG TPA: serine hydrolase [Blastocatellia bacterium]|nr:serine hydrolase [Blastocatellia bacterium]
MRSHARIRVYAIIATAIFASIPSALAQTSPPPDLDSYVARALKEFEVPGIAVAIVKDGKVVLAKGYGVRKLGEPSPVDEHTLFGIASNTKAFTAASLAMLVDEGKIGWDDPVTKHLPVFQLYDPYVTREMTIRDLLTHRSGLGLGAGDLLWWPATDYSRDEIMRRFRYVKPATSFRSRYAYDNVLYMIAGQIIPAVTGKSWDEFIKERIFKPVGMTESNTSVSAFRPGDNIAIPHAPVDGRIEAIKYINLDNVGPAGSINSNVTDLAKWMIVQLDGGALPGPSDMASRLFSQRQSREMWSAQTITPLGDPPPNLAALKANFSAYGLGWGLTDYRGKKVVSHTGGLPGYVSRVALIPDLKLGVVVLTNQESGGAFQAVVYHVFDHYLGASATDWVAAFRTLEVQERARAAEVEKRLATGRAADSKPSLPLARYAGRYVDAWYGEATISQEDGKLALRFSHTPALTGDLEHWQYDTFKVRWRDRSLNADAFVSFALKPDGGIEQMKMAAVSPLTDFSFDFQDLLFTPVTEKKSN